jgi:hypothetical protein
MDFNTGNTGKLHVLLNDGDVAGRDVTGKLEPARIGLMTTQWKKEIITTLLYRKKMLWMQCART